MSYVAKKKTEEANGILSGIFMSGDFMMGILQSDMYNNDF